MKIYLSFVDQSIIWETENQKVLDIIIDRKLNFNDYVTSICKKARKKFSVLARFSYYMSTKQRILLKIFIKSVWFIVLWCGCSIVEL